MIWSQLADFIAIQTRKTIERPSRIFIIAANLLLQELVRAPVSHFIFRKVPPKWFPTRLRAAVFFTEAKRLLDANQPHEAWEAFRICLPASKNADHYSLAAVCLAQGLGRFQESIECYARANELRWQSAVKLGIADERYRVLDEFWTTNIGHTATLDYVMKLGILEGRAPKDTILYCPAGRTVGNRFLLEQFRPLLRLLEQHSDLPFAEEAVTALQFAFLGPRRSDCKTVYFWELAAQTYRRWHAEGRPPLLELPADVEERGRQALAAAGMPRDAWFVGLHVREGGFSRSHREIHNVLNAPIDNYLPAIAEVTRRGGWVIRIGDPSMVKLPAIPNTIDYCHSAWRSDWMDVFIAAKCRFFIGTPSGPAFVPPLYGIRSVLTNWWPPGQRPWHAGDIFIPKTYRRLSDLSSLTLAQMLVEPLAWCNSVKHIETSLGVTVENNDPSDIRDAVVEMCELSDGTAAYSDEDLNLRQRADQIFDLGGAYGMGQFARDFLRRKQDFVT